MRNFVLLAVSSLLFGCGYSFQGSGTVLPPDVTSVFIAPVENSSPEAGISNELGTALRARFERFGQLEVLDDPAGAEAILETRVVDVRRETSSVTADTDTSLQVQTSMIVSATLRRASGAVLWRAPRLQVSKTIGSTAGSIVTTSPDFLAGGLGGADLGRLSSREVARAQERQALAILAEEVATKIYDDAVAPKF